MKKFYLYIVLSNFLVASLFGVVLRSFWVEPLLDLNYANVLHAHSHIALLGWLYLLIFVLFTRFFVAQNSKNQRFFSYLFWISQSSVWAMALSFPFTGYSMYSISACTIQVLCSFVFAFKVYKNLRVEDQMVRYLVGVALFFLLFCSLGLWCLGPFTALWGKGSIWATLAIQFFLHFELEGWFISAVLSLWCYYCRAHTTVKLHKVFYIVYPLSVLLGFSNSASLYVQHPVLSLLGQFAVFFQVGVVLYIFKSSLAFITMKYREISATQKLLLVCFLFFITLRMIAQIAGVLPFVHEHLSALRSWIIGFIHLNMLGIISCFGLLLCLEEKLLALGKCARLAITILVVAITLTEAILFWQGFCLLWKLPQGSTSVALYGVAFLFPSSIVLLLIGQLTKKISNE